LFLLETAICRTMPTSPHACDDGIASTAEQQMVFASTDLNLVHSLGICCQQSCLTGGPGANVARIVCPTRLESISPNHSKPCVRRKHHRFNKPVKRQSIWLAGSDVCSALRASKKRRRNRHRPLSGTGAWHSQRQTRVDLSTSGA